MENQTPEVVLPPQQLKSNFVLWIVVGVVILAAGIGVDLAVGKYLSSSNNNQKPVQKTELPVASPSVAPTETPDPTANWKTYSNSKAGFEFQYPSDLVLTEISQGGEIKIKQGNYSSNYFRFDVMDDDSLSISDYLIKADKASLLENGAQHSPQGHSAKKTVINGLNVIQREEYLPDSDVTQISTYFKKGPVTISMTMMAVPGANRDDSLYQQIISTFKFTSNKNEGVLQATVVRSPTCPGPVTEKDSCEELFKNQALKILNLPNEEFVKIIETDKDGKFSVSLVAGNYRLREIPAGFGKDRVSKIISNSDFIITADEITTQKFNIDTGIR